MIIRCFHYAFAWSMFLAVCSAASQAAEPPLPLVPWPQSVQQQPGRLALSNRSRLVVADPALLPLANIVAEEVKLAVGLPLTLSQDAPSAGDVVLAFQADLPADAHRLVVTDRVSIRGANYSAVAHGTASLLQLLRREGTVVSIPHVAISDAPQLAYRGALLDLARKPYSLETLRQCVEVCRFYKIGHLQLHLTDENAWVFPSTAYPQLGLQNFAWAGGEKPRVYPLAELKALVAYADARGVTIVPEMEVPGHSGQLRGTFPEIFGYTDASGKPASLGIINIVRPEADKVLDTLLGEVADVFASSPYIHIGCDEASLGGVDQMPEVKAFMATHKLESADAVFNAFVNRMHKLVQKRGKKMIAWEGAPLEPDLPDRSLILMPWVGGSTAAAYYVERGYSVINAPWGVKTPYMDPFLVNGAQLKQGEPKLLGTTSILWESTEDKAVPYLRQTGALRNEPTWNPTANRGHAAFVRRLSQTDPIFDRLLYGFTVTGEGLIDSQVFLRLDPTFSTSARLSFVTELKQGQVRYTLDGSEPTASSTAYSTPVTLTQPTTIKARWFPDVGPPSKSMFVRTFGKVPAVKHDGVGSIVTIAPDQPGYRGPGPQGLADGYLADGDQSASSGWVGWERNGQGVRIRLELAKPTHISKLAAHCLRAAGGIFLPTKVEFALSEDGQTFRTVKQLELIAGNTANGWYVAEIEPTTARFVQFTLEHSSDWIFMDEVAVNPQIPGAEFQHAARGRPVKMTLPPSEAYSATGVAGLTDGVIARSPDFMNLPWLGIEGKNLEATIDLGKPVEIHTIGGRFLQYMQAGIRIPETVDVLISDDGQTFKKVAAIKHSPHDHPTEIATLTINLKATKARYVRLVAYTNGLWLFCDEVFVNPIQR